jgi:hypothetical protein
MASIAGDAFGHARAGQALVGDDQRLAQAVAGDGGHGFVQAVDAHDVHGGDEEGASWPDPLKLSVALEHPPEAVAGC